MEGSTPPWDEPASLDPESNDPLTDQPAAEEGMDDTGFSEPGSGGRPAGARPEDSDPAARATHGAGEESGATGWTPREEYERSGRGDGSPGIDDFSESGYAGEGAYAGDRGYTDEPSGGIPGEPPAGPGMAGMIRRWAYGMAATDDRRSLALTAADGVDVVEQRLGGMLARPLRERELYGIADQVERNPLAAVFGAVAAGYVVSRILD